MSSCGSEELCPPSEIVTGVLQFPPAVRVEYWIRKKLPSDRVHTECTFPVLSIATCGSKPSCPGSEMLIAERKSGEACAVPANAKTDTATATRKRQRVSTAQTPPGKYPCSNEA
jgi:hypothetical protein